MDYTWDSPGKDFVKKGAAKGKMTAAEEPPWLTPAASPQPEELLCPSDSALPLR